MSHSTNKTFSFLTKSLCLALFLISSSAQSALLNIADTPLYLSGNVKPNVFFLLDDSGSMDWEVLTDKHWHFCAYDPNADGSTSSSDCGWWVFERLFRSYANSGYRWFDYIYANTDNKYGYNCSGSDDNAIEACTSAAAKDWRIYNSDVNVLYYSPGTSYSPWLGACLTDGTACTNASFTSARSNPRQGTAGYSLTRNLSGLVYQVWIDDRGFSGTRPRRGSNNNANTTPNGLVDLWDTHIKIQINSSDIKIYQVSYNPSSTSLNETETLKATLTDTSLCYNILGNESSVKNIVQNNLSYTLSNGTSCKTIPQAKENAANWYQYFRRRSLAAKNVIGSVIKDYQEFKYGLTLINKYNTVFVEVPSETANLSTHNSGLLSSLYSFEWTASGTPLRSGLEMVGKYYNNALSSHPTNPIVNACQQNFTITLTDGEWNGSTPSIVNTDVDGDGVSATLADVARYYYLRDLSPLENKVSPNPYDPATYQHMVTFMVAFGVDGNLVDTDGDGWPNPTLGVNGNWGNPTSNSSAKIDDLWHGAFNSAGFYTQAQKPEDIATQLLGTLKNISERTSSSASVAQNASILQTNAQVYQARFHSTSWKGELLAYPIDLNGVVSQTPSWNAGCKLSGGDCLLPVIPAANNPGIASNNRIIITRNWDKSQSGVAFRWPSNFTSLALSGTLTTPMKDFLSLAPYSSTTINAAQIASNAAYGQALLDYLRGSKTEEIQNGGTYAFRNRDSILGDLIHSDPLYVAPPYRLYPDALESAPYSTFRSTYSNRTPLIFVGANDGMLHGFSSSTGQEVLAYIPGNRNIYKNLPLLSTTNYAHKYFVDGGPNESDVFANGAWMTLLAGSLGKGGQGIYALNITNPSTFTEANANSIYAFEFSDEDDADLGYVHGKVTIAKVKSTTHPSGQWALIFGNGYNNTEADGYASTTGRAALFIVYIEKMLDGTITTGDYIKIPVGPSDVATPNGLAAPYAVDTNGDYIVDYVYAGDLKGNLWKFNLTNNDSTTWANQASTLFTAYKTTPGDQPITSQPIVSAHPNGVDKGLMIYFGTGKYLESTDNDSTNAVTQTFYGIWDKLDGSVPTKDKLLQQSILSEITVNLDLDNDGTNETSFDYRQVSNNPIQFNLPVDTGDPAQNLGWFMDLTVQGASSNRGERQIFQPILRNNNVIFTTILPSQSPCDFGGDSWLMELNMVNGGQPTATPFDVNQDGIFSNADYLLVPDLNGDGIDDHVPAGGQKSKVGITPTPAVFVSQDKSKEIKVLSGSTGITSISENPGSGPKGRQNWRQLR